MAKRKTKKKSKKTKSQVDYTLKGKPMNLVWVTVKAPKVMGIMMQIESEEQLCQ